MAGQREPEVCLGGTPATSEALGFKTLSVHPKEPRRSATMSGEGGMRKEGRHSEGGRGRDSRKEARGRLQTAGCKCVGKTEV